MCATFTAMASWAGVADTYEPGGRFPTWPDVVLGGYISIDYEPACLATCPELEFVVLQASSGSPSVPRSASGLHLVSEAVSHYPNDRFWRKADLPKGTKNRVF